MVIFIHIKGKIIRKKQNRKKREKKKRRWDLSLFYILKKEGFIQVQQLAIGKPCF